MKKYVKDLKDGESIREEFQLLDVQEALTKTNKPYKRFKIADKTGECTAIFWDSASCHTPFKSGDVCYVTGTVGSYQDKPQLVVAGVEPRHSTNNQDFEKCTVYDVNQLWDTMVGYLSSITNDTIRGVAEDLFLHQGYQDKFKSVPAATGMHHAFKGGLIEHTTQMLECADALLKLPFFEPLNRDLCIFGIAFHDFAKLHEYSEKPGFKKTLQGVLVPHIPMMGALIFETCNKRGVAEIVRDHLMHVVLAHHGQIAWGSPVNMACPEASFVHYVDNLHGTTFGYLQKIASKKGDELVEHWGNGGKFSLVGMAFNEILKTVESVSPQQEFDEDQLPF